MLPRERLIEIAVAVGVVAAMVATLYTVGNTYGTEDSGHQVLTATGGEIVVYVMIGFILVLAAAGVLLLRAVTVVEADDSTGDVSDV